MQFRTAIVNFSGGVVLADEHGVAKSPLFEELMRKMIGGVDRDGNADPRGKRRRDVVRHEERVSDMRSV